jgi:hypothetical protein
MSNIHQNRRWGPSHQDRKPPTDRRAWVKLGAIALIALALKGLGERLQREGPLGAAGSTIGVLVRDTLIVIAAYIVVRILKSGHLRDVLHRHELTPLRSVADQLAQAADPGAAVREHVRRLGGGAYLGLSRGASWVTADPEHAVLVLGPPRSGKTSTVVIPALLAAPGAVVSTATKGDVLAASWRARARVGQVWLFDPTGAARELPREIRRLRWSPVSAAESWDAALLMARAMAACTAPGRGTSNEAHWRERSSALLAPLLYAANLSGRSVGELLRWVLRQDLEPAGRVLEDHEATAANDVLIGIAKTDARERSSIFSATAGVLAAYNADATRRAATNANFEPTRFVGSSDTVYITAPAHRQALCAPLVVGLLEQIRHAAYARAAGGVDGGPVFLCLDEVANIAPIHDLPALVSEAGGQKLHVMACLQDLSQRRREAQLRISVRIRTRQERRAEGFWLASERERSQP